MGQIAAEAVPVFVELQPPCDRVRPGVRHLYVGHLPSGKGGLHVAAGRPVRQGSSAPGREDVEQHSGVVEGKGDTDFLGSGALEFLQLRRRQVELVHGEIIGHVLGVCCASESDQS